MASRIETNLNSFGFKFSMETLRQYISSWYRRRTYTTSGRCNILFTKINRSWAYIELTAYSSTWRTLNEAMLGAMRLSLCCMQFSIVATERPRDSRDVRVKSNHWQFSIAVAHNTQLKFSICTITKAARSSARKAIKSSSLIHYYLFKGASHQPSTIPDARCHSMSTRMWIWVVTEAWRHENIINFIQKNGNLRSTRKSCAIINVESSMSGGELPKSAIVLKE